MPVVNLPDGKRINFPDGVSPEDMAAALSQMNVQPSPPEGVGLSEQIVRGLKDPVDGGAQMLMRALPGGVVNAINSATQYVNDLPYIGPVTKALGMVPATSETIDRDIKSAEQDYQSRRGPDAGMDWGRLVGNVAATLPLAAAAPATVPGALTSGAVMGGLQPVTDGGNNFLTEKAKQASLGAAGGFAGNLIGRGISGAVAGKVNPDVQSLLNRGVVPTPGQILGGGAKAFEEKMTSVPILGDVVRSGQRRVIDQFNRATFDDILKPIGATAPQGVGRDAVTKVGDAISDGYNNLIPNLTFKADAQLVSEVRNLATLAKELPAKEASQFNRFLSDKLAKAMGPQGVADGQTFKELESALSREAGLFAKSQDAYQQKLGDAFSDLLSSLRDGLARSNAGTMINVAGKPVDAGQRLKDLNLAWAKLVRLERAAGMQGAADGVFTPSQLSSAVKGADSSARHRGYARGTALMQDLSDPAKNVIGNTVPDSGTPGRLAAMLAGGGAAAGYLNPWLLAGAIPAIPYLPGGQRLTAALLAQRPNFAPQVSAATRKAIPSVQAAASGAFAQNRPNSKNNAGR